MNEKEKEETEEQKQEGSKEGKQFVPNTSRARSAKKKANEEGDDPLESNKGRDKKEGRVRQTRSKRRKQEAHCATWENHGEGEGAGCKWKVAGSQESQPQT